ncbi:hypothetical protein R3P38DRAFT_2794643 [Favolaschia claudopus]|uniref:Uncharacterized protein n=1 Tax=Favolaschia claudopus TaxID=2862362 RepID=A0AAW0AA25_9AGAR
MQGIAERAYLPMVGFYGAPGPSVAATFVEYAGNRIGSRQKTEVLLLGHPTVTNKYARKQIDIPHLNLVIIRVITDPGSVAQVTPDANRGAAVVANLAGSEEGLRMSPLSKCWWCQLSA